MAAALGFFILAWLFWKIGSRIPIKNWDHLFGKSLPTFQDLIGYFFTIGAIGFFIAGLVSLFSQ